MMRHAFTARLLGLALFLLPALAASGAPDLLLGPGDLRIEQLADGGYHLYIRKKGAIASVLLTETTKDPAKKEANYAYRAPNYNPINGDERRMLDGAFLPQDRGYYWLIDSSAQPDPVLGEAFHVFIPWVVAWGYPWTRNGETFIADGTFINIRTFTKPYADYQGEFLDNPYVIKVTQRPLPRPPKPPAPPELSAPPPLAPKPVPEPPLASPAPPPAPTPPAPPPAPAPAPEPKPDTSMYMDETLRSFESIAKAGKGEVRYSEGEADIVPELAALLDRALGERVDLVICLDTTDSMKDDIEAVKRAIPEMLRERLADFPSFRLGFVLYKDYFEDYLVKKFDFTEDFRAFTAGLSSVRVSGGRDIPEAVYEALYTALTEYPWAAEKKMIVLIGDAPPHPIPRGNVDRAKVEAEAAARGIELDVIILPH